MSTSPSSSKRRIRILGFSFCAVAIVVLGVFLWAWMRFQSSLPQLEGSAAVTGLSGAVTLERDATGIVTVRGPTVLDVARGLGYAHGQDRFFQMDLLRRRAAGEIAELFGPAALPLDRGVRMHESRSLSQQVVKRLTPAEREQLEALRRRRQCRPAKRGTPVGVRCPARRPAPVVTGGQHTLPLRHGP